MVIGDVVGVSGDHVVIASQEAANAFAAKIGQRKITIEGLAPKAAPAPLVALAQASDLPTSKYEGIGAKVGNSMQYAHPGTPVFIKHQHGAMQIIVQIGYIESAEYSVDMVDVTTFGQNAAQFMPGAKCFRATIRG